MTMRWTRTRRVVGQVPRGLVDKQRAPSQPGVGRVCSNALCGIHVQVHLGSCLPSHAHHSFPYDDEITEHVSLPPPPPSWHVTAFFLQDAEKQEGTARERLAAGTAAGRGRGRGRGRGTSGFTPF